MNSSVRINVRVLMGNALAQFQRLTAQMRMLEIAAARSASQATNFGARWSRSFERITLAGKRLSQTGRILTYNFTLPLVMALGALEKEFFAASKAGATLSQVYETATGETKQFGVASAEIDDSLRNLDKAARIMSDGFGVAKSAVMDIMVVFSRAGLHGVQIAEATETALTLMQAFGTTAEQAADAYMTASVAYQLNGKQTAVAMAMLGYAANETRADVQTLSAGFIKAAPTAQQLGIDIGTLTAWLAVMQQAGFKGAEAGTALNFAFTRLVKATPEAIDLFKRVGLNIEEASFAAANGTERMRMVKDALQDLTGAQRAYAIAVMFGVRQQPKLTALLADMLREGGMVDKLLKDMTDSTELLAYMDNQLILSQDNVSDKFKILKTQMMNNFMVIANYLTPAIMALMTVFRNASRWFAELGNTARGRTVQAFIVFGAVVLALVGPLTIIIASFVTLVGYLGAAAVAIGGFAALLISPWTLVAAALAGLLVFSQRFRDAFISVFRGMARAVMQIAMFIYEAFQWMNPFARHSPSLVEQTRDGVAAMVRYWKNLSPVLTFFDNASTAVRKFGAAMSAFTKSIEDADAAQKRADIGAVAGPGAVKAYDELLAKNKELAASLPSINTQYIKQAKVVEDAKKRLDGANEALETAEKRMEGLRREQRLLQDSLKKLGDPQALQSQSDAAANMARTLAEAGNMELAGQFAEQAQAMSEQSKEAQKQQAALDKVDSEIDKQAVAIENLMAQRDLLAATYDLEREKLDALEQGYRSVEEAIRGNEAAANDAATAARRHLDELEAARKAAEAAAKSAKGGAEERDPFAQFDAAGTSNLPDMVGDTALPGPPQGAGNEDWDKYLAELQQRTGDRMAKLFPNPFKMVGDWLDKLKSGWKSVETWLDDVFGGGGDVFKNGKQLLEGLEPPSGSKWAGWAAPVKVALQEFKTTLQGISMDDLKARFQAGLESIKQGWENATNALSKPMEKARDAIGKALGVVIGIVKDVVKIIATRLKNVLGIVADFWKTNGDEIGTIVGTLIGWFIDWYRLLLEIATWVTAKLWPVFRFAFDGIFQAVQGLFEVFSGFFTMIIQLLTGDFKAAWDGFLQMLSGIGNILMGLGKVLIGVIVGFAVWLVGTGLGMIGTALMGLGPIFLRALVGIGKLFGKLVVWIAEALIKMGAKVIELLPGIGSAFATFFKELPGRLWSILTTAWSKAWKIVEWIGKKIEEWAPAIFDSFINMIKQVPGKMWDAMKAAWEAYVKFSEFVGTKVREYGPKVWEAFVNMIKETPGKMWDALKTAWTAYIKFNQFVGDKVKEYTPKVIEAFVNMIKEAPGKMWDALKTAWTAYIKFSQFVGDKVREWTPGIVKFFTDLFGSIPGKLWDALKYMWGKTIDFAGFVRGKVEAARTAILDKAKSVGSDIVNGIKIKLDELLSGAMRMGGRIIDIIKIAPSAIATTLSNLGKNIVEGIAGGIKKFAGAIWAALKGGLTNAWDRAREWAKMKSPSRKFRDEFGVPLMQGLAIGITKSAPGVSDAMVNAAKTAYDNMSAVAQAQMTMPVLTQNIRFNYLDNPLTSLSDVSGRAVTGAMLAQSGSGGGAGVYAPHIEVTTAPGEAADPFAFGQALAWSMRTQVG